MRESRALFLASKAAKAAEVGTVLGGVAESVLYLRSAYGIHDAASTLLFLPHVDGYIQNVLAGGVVAILSSALAFGLDAGAKGILKRSQLVRKREERKLRKDLNAVLNAYDYSSEGEQATMRGGIKDGSATVGGDALRRGRAAAEISELRGGDREQGKHDLEALEDAAKEIPSIAGLIGMLGRDDHR